MEKPSLARTTFALSMGLGLSQVGIPLIAAPWLALFAITRQHQPLGAPDWVIMLIAAVAVPVGALLLAVTYKIGQWGGCWK